MMYRGRQLDAVSLWEEFVEFPHNADLSGGFAPLVRCPNPDHNTSKRHFQVNLDAPMVHCFAACGISGSYAHAIAMIKGIDEREARRIIVRHTRVGLGPSSRRKVRRADGTVARAGQPSDPEIVSLDYERYLPAFGLEYLAERGIGAESIARFEIGWDADERRIVLPADDERGVRRFLIKRATRDRDYPKYLYWPEGTSKTALLYGACKLDREQVHSHGLVLCEGSLDAIRLQQHEIQATAILGTGLSVRQAHIVGTLRPRRVFFMFDKDGAGVKNIRMAAPRLTKVPVFVCLYPKGKSDPAELTRKEARRAIESAMPLAVFMKRLPRPERRKENVYG